MATDTDTEAPPDTETGIPPISVVVAGDEILISEYKAVDLIKSLPLRRWDRARKAWIVPAALLADVEKRLGTWPGGIIVSRVTPPPPPPTRTGAGWAEHMFASLPDRLHKPVFRSLSTVLHPDAGGDTEAMAALSAARERIAS